MLIIAGHLVVPADERDAFVAGCQSVVEAAREADGCVEFAITADSVDPARVMVYERWETETHLLAFRGDGPGPEHDATIRSAEVHRFGVSTVGEP